LAAVDELAEKAFDDQCTPTNPRYPLISEIHDLFVAAYYANGHTGNQDCDCSACK